MKRHLTAKREGIQQSERFLNLICHRRDTSEKQINNHSTPSRIVKMDDK